VSIDTAFENTQLKMKKNILIEIEINQKKSLTCQVEGKKL
jgi:hypothetical protein